MVFRGDRHWGLHHLTVMVDRQTNSPSKFPRTEGQQGAGYTIELNYYRISVRMHTAIRRVSNESC